MTAEPRSNPFRPGVGIRPRFVAGRDGEVRRFRSALRSAPAIPANVRLTGLRGVGKTVLLAEFERAAGEEGWATAHLELEPRHNTESALSGALGDLLARARELLSKAARVRAAVGKVTGKMKKVAIVYQDVTVSLDREAAPEGTNVARALLEVVQGALDQDRHGLVLLLDEAQVLRDDRSRDGEHPLSLLIAAVGAIQKEELPLGLVICGLPTLTGNLLAARSYTERMFRGEHIGSLDHEAAREAFMEPLRETGITAADALVKDVLDAVEGYPYFIQLWGAELWDAAEHAGRQQLTRALLRAIEPDIYRRLDLDFYDPRVMALTPAEQDVLAAAAQCSYPPLKVAELYGEAEKTPANVNVLLGRLVEAGVLYRVRKGQYEYTAPKFYEYLRRRFAAEPGNRPDSSRRVQSRGRVDRGRPRR